jgi:hypothetical protein
MYFGLQAMRSRRNYQTMIHVDSDPPGYRVDIIPPKGIINYFPTTSNVSWSLVLPLTILTFVYMKFCCFKFLCLGPFLAYYIYIVDVRKQLGQ